MHLTLSQDKYHELATQLLSTITESDIEETIEWIVEIDCTNTTGQKTPILVNIRNTLLITIEIGTIEYIIYMPKDYLENYQCQEIAPLFYLTKFQTIIDYNNRALYTHDNTNLAHLIGNLIQVDQIKTSGRHMNTSEIMDTARQDTIDKIPIITKDQVIKIQ